jgi:hypothetical protein
MSELDQRIMRIRLPVALIREMDAAIIKGVGGYTTRTEFIIDAIQERVLDLTVPREEDGGPPPGYTTREVRPQPGDAAELSEGLESASADISVTALPPLTQGSAIQASEEFSQPEGRPLFGLHNRDYPSLWALSRLADLTTNGPIEVEAYYTEVCEQAWKFGELLLDVERQIGGKWTALFPTNREKKKAAEAGFRTFAIGGYRRGPNGVLFTSGPLFEWRVADFAAVDGPELLVGVTPAGWALLEAIAGMTIEEPRPVDVSEPFLAHLARHAPADWSGFVAIIRAVGAGGGTRQDVLDHVAKTWPDWTPSEVSTNAAGYIARAREWGLVEPKQTKSRYHLTSLGLDRANGAQ